MSKKRPVIGRSYGTNKELGERLNQWSVKHGMNTSKATRFVLWYGLNMLAAADQWLVMENISAFERFDRGIE